MKTCTGCKRDLPREAFGVRKRSFDGLCCRCLECRRQDWSASKATPSPPPSPPHERAAVTASPASTGAGWKHPGNERAYRRVWAAVMVLTVNDARDYLHKPQRTKKHTGPEAMSWILSDSPRAGGFVWACDILDVDPDFVRYKVARK